MTVSGRAALRAEYTSFACDNSPTREPPDSPAAYLSTDPCKAAGDEVLGVSRSPSVGAGVALDVSDTDGLRRMILETPPPEVIYHLASLSSVGRSWEEPAATVEWNVAVAVSMLEAVRREAADARLVWASGSCEVYGDAGRISPTPETAPLRPANPYAVSKATGDLLAAVYADAHGLDLVRVRPFSHAGPRQLPIFILSSLARQAAMERLSDAPVVRLVTGNPSTRRDFTDVLDALPARRLLATQALSNRVTFYSTSPRGESGQRRRAGAAAG